MSGGGNEALGTTQDVKPAADGDLAARARLHGPLRRWLGAHLLAPVEATLAGQIAQERPRFVNWLPVLFGLGIWGYFALGVEPSRAAAVLPLICGLVLARLTPTESHRHLFAMALIMAGAGFAVAKVRTERVAAPVLERPLRAVQITGILEQREPHAKRGERLTLRLVSVADVEPDRMPQRARIRIMSPAGDIKPGDALQLTASLSAPSAPALPGGHDFARAAYYQRIGAVGYALKPPQKVTLADLPEPDLALRIRAAVEDLRQDIGRRIEVALPGERGALAAALITGERGGISQETTDAYRDSGLVHILSISGLHMAIMAGAVFALLRFALATIPALALTQPIKKWAAAGGAIGAILYFAISGGSAATLRSAIMMVVMFLAIMLGRPAIAMRNVAIAALLILIVYPESLLDVGFQMSFAAVAALVAAYEAIRGHFDRSGLTPGPVMRAGLFLGGILFSTLIAGFAVTPLSVYHFHAMQHYAPLANLIAVPVCNLLVMPAALATLVALPFGLEAAPLWLMGVGIDVMGWMARFVAALPGAVTNVAQVPDLAFASALMGGLWLVLWQKRWRLAGIPLILGGLALTPSVERADVLIGREGALVAVRGQDGLLAAHAERPSTFELKRWLEHDGDARDPKDVRKERAFRCDALGCVSQSGDVVIAISRHPGGAADDCERAGVLIVTGARPPLCSGPAQIMDRASLRASGTVALYRTPEGSFRSESVADVRGARPWSMPPVQRRPREPSTPPAIPEWTSPENSLDVSRYAAPRAVADAFDSPADLRPEIEDDEP
jgi:competence protein ComEC